MPGWARHLLWYGVLLVRKWPVALVLAMTGEFVESGFGGKKAIGNVDGYSWLLDISFLMV
jgi:hypothetical protein